MSTFVALVNNDATIFSSKVLISEAYAKHSQMLTDHLYLQSLPHIVLYMQCKPARRLQRVAKTEVTDSLLHFITFDSCQT